MSAPKTHTAQAQVLPSVTLNMQMPSGAKIRLSSVRFADFIEMLSETHFKTPGDIVDAALDIQSIFIDNFPEDGDVVKFKQYMKLLEAFVNLTQELEDVNHG